MGQCMRTNKIYNNVTLQWLGGGKGMSFSLSFFCLLGFVVNTAVPPPHVLSLSLFSLLL